MASNMADPPELTTPSPTRRRSSVLASPMEDGPDTCRICRGEATSEQPLFYPCKCSGSIRFVHQDCLMEWLSHSQKKYCELCKTPFRFTKLYDRSMPESVPWLLFLRQVVIHTTRAVGRWARYAIVIFVWLCWLPWTIRQVWRALFWLADGSWTTQYEMQAAIDAYAGPLTNASAPPNITTTRVEGNTGPAIGLVSTLFAVLGIFDPQILLRAMVKTVWHVAISPALHGGPIKWEKAFLFAPIPRPPSLLSDFQSITSATRLPILNNALLDVLEGQLVCLAIVTAFILVFLIREWVINQQPLPNIPEDGPVDDVAPAQPVDPPRQQRVRRRHRGIRRIPDENVQLENAQPAPVQRPLAQPRPRRNLTEDNILVPNLVDEDRPARPVRAASLVPALQELEANVRLLERYGDVESTPEPTVQEDALHSPPLQRGAFDDVGHIQRSIEERGLDVTEDILAAATSDEAESTEATAEVNAPQQPLSDHAVPQDTDQRLGANQSQPAQSTEVPGNEFTFRWESPAVASEPKSTQPARETTNKSGDGEWDSESDGVAIPTPQTPSDVSQHANASEPPVTTDADLDGSVSNPITEPVVDDHEDEEPEDEIIAADPEQVVVHASDDLLTRLSKWLWHTDDFVPGEPAQVDTDDTEIVADIDAEAPFVPARNQNRLPEIPAEPAAPPAAPAPQQNIQNGINVNDPLAVDEAEDLEGILELIGMEGPIAGMFQNIIFSVFLITLTLSASLWCPYIWGKIALLFIAHPVSVFIKAPLFVLSRSADFIVDIGLWIISSFGVLLDYIVRIAAVAILPFSPKLSHCLDTDMLTKLFGGLYRTSGSRLQKAVTRTLLGFRPDLPTFSVQSHHVLRVFKRVAADVFVKGGFALLSWVVDTIEACSWHGLFTFPVKIGAGLKAFPARALTTFDALQEWLTQLQADLRPLSFSDSEEVDYSLIQWSAKEKIVCIILGYMLFAVAGAIYLRFARWFFALRDNEKVPGFLADTLRQAGGVMKVIIIIGIEMIVFPLYCGFMLDIALLPLFEGKTIFSRLQFFGTAPFTALFIHWFMGTCYMFHFALFVSMCRKLMRKGVLYFIRDPDDPSFHPVRDVLERPVATQLGKIAFSAFVYGSLLVICLGGVVTGLNRVGKILPIRWGAVDPDMVIPGDIIFYNFFLPIILRKIDIPSKVSTVFAWWFRACAAGLRLSDFMFGQDNEDEKKPGAFLWHRFWKVFVHGESTTKHPMVKYVEELASHRERLVWFEAKEGEVDNETARAVFGPEVKFKIINLLGDKSQGLVEFDEGTHMETIRNVMNTEAAKLDSRYHIRRVKDMKVEQIALPNLRNTPVDTAAGAYVRTPAKDSVRIPKGTNVFLPVNEKNERLDGKDDLDTGLHGKKDERFSRIYVPNHFRARTSAFIGLVWLFGAAVGLFFTIGPLIVGRTILNQLTSPVDGKPVNDLYALTIGGHAFAATVYLGLAIGSRWSGGVEKLTYIFKNSGQVLRHIASFAQRVLGITYLFITIGFLGPMGLSLLAELYVNIPVYAWLATYDDASSTPSNPLLSTTQGIQVRPVIHVLQTWAMGLLYTRLFIRIVTHTTDTDTRPAAAIRAITRQGLLRPNVRLASRALVLPILVISASLIGLPLLLARTAIAAYPGTLTEAERAMLYRYSYPAILSIALASYMLLRLRSRIEDWRVKIRDEVYLIGERLHNFPAQDDHKSNKGRKKQLKAKSKGKEKSSSVGEQAKATADVEQVDVRESSAAEGSNDIAKVPNSNTIGVEDDQQEELARMGTMSVGMEKSSLTAETDQFSATKGHEEVAEVDGIGEVGSSVFDVTHLNSTSD